MAWDGGGDRYKITPQLASELGACGIRCSNGPRNGMCGLVEAAFEQALVDGTPEPNFHGVMRGSMTPQQVFRQRRPQD